MRCRRRRPQLLAYYAGRTKRIQLGTSVIVLPWHDPIRVAEQIALLDILCGGRCLFGFGRGAASVEYEGFRIPMDEARPRFIEGAEIIQRALTQESFEYPRRVLPDPAHRDPPARRSRTRNGASTAPRSVRIRSR